MKTTALKAIGAHFAELGVMIVGYLLLLWYFIAHGYIFTPYNWEISLIISVLFATGAAMVGYHLATFYREDAQLAAGQERLRAAASALNAFWQEQALLPKAQVALTLRQIIDEHFVTLAPSLFKTRVYRLTEMVCAAQTANQDFLSQIVQQEEEMKGSRVRYIAAILIVVGLLGTFLGLVQSVKYLQNFFLATENVDLNSLFSDMRQTLGGLDKAFGTSIGGITAYLVLGYLNVVLRTRQVALLHRLENVTLTSLLPLFSGLERTPAQEVSAQAVEILQTIPVTLAQELSQAFETVMKRTIGGSSADLKATGLSLQAAAQQMQAGQATFEQTLTGLATFLNAFQTGQDQMVNAQQGMSTGVQRFSDALSHLEVNQNSLALTTRYIESAENRMTSMDDVVKRMYEVWQANRDIFAQIAGLIQQEHQQVAQAVDHFTATLDETKAEAQYTFQHFQNRMDALLTKSDDVHANLFESHTLLTTLVRDLKTFVCDEQNGLRLISASLDETFGETKLQYLQLTDHLEALYKRIHETQEQVAHLRESSTAIQHYLQNRRSA